MNEVARIKVGNTQGTTDITSDGKTLLVTINAENSLDVIDLASSKTDKIPVGNGPAQMFIEPNDRFAFIANQGTTENPSFIQSNWLIIFRGFNGKSIVFYWGIYIYNTHYI